LPTITEFLSRLEPLLPNLQIAPKQNLFVETFTCEDGVGELHVVEGGAMVDRSSNEGVLANKSTMWNPPIETQPT